MLTCIQFTKAWSGFLVFTPAARLHGAFLSERTRSKTTIDLFGGRHRGLLDAESGHHQQQSRPYKEGETK
jgi:hypothetical protein